MIQLDHLHQNHGPKHHLRVYTSHVQTPTSRHLHSTRHPTIGIHRRRRFIGFGTRRPFGVAAIISSHYSLFDLSVQLLQLYRLPIRIQISPPRPLAASHPAATSSSSGSTMIVPLIPRSPFGPPPGQALMMRPPLPPGPPPFLQDDYAARPTVPQKPSYVKSAASTVVKRPLAQHTPELTAMVPASVRVRRETAIQKSKPNPSLSTAVAAVNKPAVARTEAKPENSYAELDGKANCPESMSPLQTTNPSIFMITKAFSLNLLLFDATNILAF